MHSYPMRHTPQIRHLEHLGCLRCKSVIWSIDPLALAYVSQHIVQFILPYNLYYCTIYITVCACVCEICVSLYTKARIIPISVAPCGVRQGDLDFAKRYTVQCCCGSIFLFYKNSNNQYNKICKIMKIIMYIALPCGYKFA